MEKISITVPETSVKAIERKIKRDVDPHARIIGKKIRGPITMIQLSISTKFPDTVKTVLRLRGDMEKPKEKGRPKKEEPQKDPLILKLKIKILQSGDRELIYGKVKDSLSGGIVISKEPAGGREKTLYILTIKLNSEKNKKQVYDQFKRKGFNPRIMK